MSIDKQKLKDGINEDYSRTTTNAPFYDGMRKAYHEILNDIDDGRFNSEVNISSLITTIESQKEEIEKWRKEAFANHPTQWDYDQACAALNKTKLEIEGYKAITELAVKGLQESKLAFKWATEYGHLKTCTCAECNALGTVEFTLSEIKRLQNDPIS